MPLTKDQQTYIDDALRALTEGRPFIFMIMSYEAKRRPLYDCIAKVAGQLGIDCIRADQVLGSGYPLLEKLHRLIEEAELVVAEISVKSPNVFYEIGYAVAVNKPPILVMEEGLEMPTDLKGLEIIQYSNTVGGDVAMEPVLYSHMQRRLDRDLACLRDMLLAPMPGPSYIVTSPKYPGALSRMAGQVFDRRTFGDHLGIQGLLYAFGALRGDASGTELISAQYAPPDLLEFSVNLYLIGSRKVNPVCAGMLDALQHGQPTWRFGPQPGVKEEENWPVMLYRRDDTGEREMRGETKFVGDPPAEIWKSDYGILVRGPHPMHRGAGYIAMVMAGAHSLGTGAACLVATRASLIARVKERLGAGILADKEATFWVLVKGNVSETDNLLDDAGVEIVDAGVYTK